MNHVLKHTFSRILTAPFSPGYCLIRKWPFFYFRERGTCFLRSCQGLSDTIGREGKLVLHEGKQLWQWGMGRGREKNRSNSSFFPSMNHSQAQCFLQPREKHHMQSLRRGSCLPSWLTCKAKHLTASHLALSGYSSSLTITSLGLNNQNPKVLVLYSWASLRDQTLGSGCGCLTKFLPAGLWEVEYTNSRSCSLKTI